MGTTDPSGVLPDGPERAEGDGVGQHGQQVDPEQQDVQHVAHLQPLFSDVPARLFFLQVLSDGGDLVEDVVHDRRRAVPNAQPHPHRQDPLQLSGTLTVVVMTSYCYKQIHNSLRNGDAKKNEILYD